MLKFISDRRKRAAEQRRRNGYEYAARVLLLGNEVGSTVPAVEYLEANVDISRSFGSFDEFDCGVLDAVARWKERQQELERCKAELSEARKGDVFYQIHY